MAESLMSENQILLTLVVPCYNAENTLTTTLDSLSVFTGESIEILVIDDGSSDGTRAVLENHASQDSRIKIVSQANAGVSAARNTGIEQARGRYVWFIDADDTITPNAISFLLGAINNDAGNDDAGNNQVTTVMVFRSNFITEGHTSTSGSLTERTVKDAYGKISIIDELVHKSSFNPVWNKIYLREFLISNQILFPQGISHGEDVIFNCQVFATASSVSVYNAVLYNYIIHASSAMGAPLGTRASALWQALAARRLMVLELENGLPEKAVAVEQLYSDILYQLFGGLILEVIAEIKKGNLPSVFQTVKLLRGQGELDRYLIDLVQVKNRRFRKNALIRIWYKVLRCGRKRQALDGKPGPAPR